MTKHRTRLERAEQRAVELSRRATTTNRAALMDGIIAKAERALRGEVLEPADWTNAPAAVREHRERLLECLRTRRD